MKALSARALLCAVMFLAGVDGTPIARRSASCPRKWTKIQGRCFHYVHATLTWAEAERNCRSMGANLASVHSAAEYRGIQLMIHKITHGYGMTWLGASDCQTEGVWLWSDGTPFDYHHCGTFDNSWWRQHCLQMNYGENKCWDDVQCYTKLPYVCAKKR